MQNFGQNQIAQIMMDMHNLIMMEDIYLLLSERTLLFPHSHHLLSAVFTEPIDKILHIFLWQASDAGLDGVFFQTVSILLQLGWSWIVYRVL